jgi:hypothetical protein
LLGMTTFVKKEPQDIMEESPEYKRAVKFVLKQQIQNMVSGAHRVMTWYKRAVKFVL